MYSDRVLFTYFLLTLLHSTNSSQSAMITKDEVLAMTKGIFLQSCCLGRAELSELLEISLLETICFADLMVTTVNCY